ncbi:hypothetical protein XCR1_1150023 [Xenorhabdus cabanillasii JM26]|uniref:Uncharacterized protein n=1 Tax=Xenorhabdus cabanillasii JM26 TaxID=1427517 RepID=W1IPF1_9GAMM|nr:hypothetical protein XCR1_1150023 [Xenorhabdus cabanillasii JM26]
MNKLNYFYLLKNISPEIIIFQNGNDMPYETKQQVYIIIICLLFGENRWITIYHSNCFTFLWRDI